MKPSAEIRIRRARPSDIEGVARLGLEALEKDAYEYLVIDPAKVRAAAGLVISGAGNYCIVAELDGLIVGAVSAVVDECLFYERKQISVIQFYSKVPGVGVRLMREFLTWARSRPVIKVIIWTLDVNADPRIGKLLKRLGMTEQLPVWTEIR